MQEELARTQRDAAVNVYEGTHWDPAEPPLSDELQHVSLEQFLHVAALVRRPGPAAAGAAHAAAAAAEQHRAPAAGCARAASATRRTLLLPAAARQITSRSFAASFGGEVDVPAPYLVPLIEMVRWWRGGWQRRGGSAGVAAAPRAAAGRA